MNDDDEVIRVTYGQTERESDRFRKTESLTLTRRAHRTELNPL